MSTNEPTLQRKLQPRHINLMALGTTIGVGLFLGAATAIKIAGPAILIAYAIGGMAIFFIMRALGEMAVHQPTTGSFSHYANDYISPLAGFLTGWNYWLLWISTCMAEISAVGIYMTFWFPNTPTWIWAISATIFICAINLMTVKVYGEIEFWFALIKIITILAMIVCGFGLIFFGLGNHFQPVGISNLWSHGGFLPHGISGIVMALQMVMYAYLGIEMLGLTAGEAKNPKKSLTTVVNTVFWRILIFYIGSIFVILSIYPWNELSTQQSPFVSLFNNMGIRTAAGLINFVVLSAALSSCNGGIFSTSRMLFHLGKKMQAPSALTKVTKQGVPILATLSSIAVLLIGVLLNYIAPKQIFIWLTAIATFCAIWTWIIILVAHLNFRKKVAFTTLNTLPVQLPMSPYSNYVVIVFLLFIVFTMVLSPSTRDAFFIGPIWIASLCLIYFCTQHYRKTVVMQSPTP